jgi:hypothetical protein
MRKCDSATRLGGHSESQSNIGMEFEQAFSGDRGKNVKLSRSNAGCLDVPDAEVCTSPARELLQGDHSPRVGKARSMLRGTDCRNAVIDPADSNYSFKVPARALCSSKSVKCTEVSARCWWIDQQRESTTVRN